MDYEREALTLLSYKNQVVPGLLRTEEYARAVFSCLYPPISAEEAKERVSARLQHAGLNGLMVLLETPDHDHLAYLEGQRMSFLVEAAAVVSHERDAYESRILKGHGPLGGRLRAWADDGLPALERTR
jgi:hypothetical protein